MSAALSSGNATVKILTADDHPLLREAVGRLIAEVGSPVEVLEADSLRGAEDLIAANRDLALVILDVLLPDATGIEAVERVLRAHPDLPVLVVSARDDPQTARAVLDSGARGFISKRSPTRVLAEAIRLVLVGGTYVPPEALREPASTTRDGDAFSADPDAPTSAPRVTLGITPRQVDVLALLVQGAPNKRICRTLRLAEGTVKAHIPAIYRSLNVMNRKQAVYAVSRLGLALPAAITTQKGDAVRDERRPAQNSPMRFIGLFTVLGRPAAFEGA